MPAGDPVNRIREIFEILEFFPVFRAPGKVLVAEMIDSTDFIPGPVCRLRNMACGKAGDQHPPFHNSSVCFPAFEGMMRICAPGNSFFSSWPGEEVVEEEREARDLGMGLAGDGHIVIGKAVDLARHFFRPDNDEDLFLRPDLPDHVRQVQPVHREVDDYSARLPSTL